MVLGSLWVAGGIESGMVLGSLGVAGGIESRNSFMLSLGGRWDRIRNSVMLYLGEV